MVDWSDSEGFILEMIINFFDGLTQFCFFKNYI